jgi:hypothetical protein
MSSQVFTSRVWVVPDTFGYEEIRFDIVNRLNISRPLFIYINDEKSIKIEQLRELQKELASAPLDSHTTRVVLIHPLERLLHVSQQALLKLLEEPPDRTIVILAGNSLNGLAPTILSRCEVIRVEQGSASTHIDSFWTQAETASPDELVRLLSAAPDKKDEAIAWIREQLSSAPAPSKKSAVLLESLNEAYEALLSNVTPKLVWGRVVRQFTASEN